MTTDDQGKMVNTPIENEVNDQERINRLSETPPHDDSDLIPIKIREKVKESIKRAAETVDDGDEADQVVAEYEQRYNRHLREDELPMVNPPEKQKRGSDSSDESWGSKWHFNIPPQHRRAPRSAPANLMENEKTWAALAHASTVLTILLGLGTGGIATLLTMFIPMGIYFYFRDESEYVARNALQAFAAQVVGTIGFVALLFSIFVVGAIMFTISLILIITVVGAIVGIPLLLVTIFAAILALVGSVALPFAVLIYSLIATFESLHGKSYSYPWIGDWVDDQLYGMM